MLASCLTTVLLSACMANPGDAPTVEGDNQAGAEQSGNGNNVDEAHKLREISVGVDEFVDGFNPHLIADTSAVTDLVARLTLPSAFVPDPANPAKLLINDDLLESAEVIDGAEPAPTKVRYRIRQGAQWDDGTPISGEDFLYLRNQITSTPGSRGSAQYALIDRIDILDAGRTVEVDFAEPMAAWQELFFFLMPSHLLKSNPEGFHQVMQNSMPASGGRYSVEAMDVGRNIIRLVRNDRFWGKDPAVAEAINLRAVRNAVEGAGQLRSGQLQVAQVHPHETTALTFGLVPQVSAYTHKVPRSMVLSANLAAPRLADRALRSDLLSLIDVSVVSAAATGNAPESGAGGDATAGATKSGDTEVGINNDRESQPTALRHPNQFTEDEPLRIGVLNDGSSARAAAAAVADQLTTQGIPAEVVSTDSRGLSRSQLPYGKVDMVVSWADAIDNDNPVSAVAAARNRYVCPSPAIGSLRPSDSPESSTSSSATGTAESSKANESSASQGTQGEPEDTATGTVEPTPGQPEKSGKVADSAVARTENVSGLCNPDVDQLLTADRTQVPPELASLISAEAIELSLFSDSLLTVIGNGVDFPDNPNSQDWPSEPLIGKLSTIPQWQRDKESLANADALERK